MENKTGFQKYIEDFLEDDLCDVRGVLPQGEHQPPAFRLGSRLKTFPIDSATGLE